MRYPTLDELAATEEEKAAARKVATAPGESQAVGGGIGTILGGALGALGIPLGLGEVTIPLGASLGGAAGGAIGGSIGAGDADKAQAVLDEAEQARQRKLTEMQLRQQALDALKATE